MTATTFRRLRRRLTLTQTGFAALLGTTGNSVARMERAEVPISEPMARLALLVAYLAARGDDYAVDMAAKRRRSRKRPARAR